MTALPTPDNDSVTVVDNILGNPYNCILFNDEEHSAEEVANQIVKAIHCDPSKAEQIMLEAHTTGRAIVITASLERCEHVESVLSAIRLGTKIEPA
jgi:ATP-dependent Clp protease adaptor protein ClpS